MSFPAPLLFTNGVIHTMQDHTPPAEALALDRMSGAVIAAGAERDVRAALGVFAQVETVDLRGHTVIPGLIDAHTHLLSAASDTVDLDLANCKDEQDAAARVGARAKDLPPGTWIRGRHWNQQFWPGQQFPTRRSLDAVAPDHPVMLWTHSQHALWVNSLALIKAGITREAPDPPGAAYGRDADGDLTGMLFEYNATDRVEDVMETESIPGEEEYQALRRIVQGLSARGLTGVHNIESAHSLRLMQRLYHAGELPVRVNYYLRVSQLEPARAVGLEGGFGDERLRIAGVKLFADGALGTHTAAMLQAYDDDPGNLGILTTPADVMEARVTQAARGGLGVAIHAIGDRAVRVALDGIARAQAVTGPQQRPRRYRVEHIQIAALEDIQRMAKLGVVASVQPFHAVSDRDVADRSWGARAAQSYAYHTMAQVGAPLAFGSDQPIETNDPWRILHAAIARTDDASGRPAWHEAEAVAPMQGLWAYTVGAAYAGGDEAHLGRLAPGMRADCVILAHDPLRCSMADLAQMPVIATIVGGKVVYGQLPG